MRALWWTIKTLLRVAWTSAMVLVPLFGFWLASSLAAYQNATQWVALGIGLGLFPLVPIAWEALSAWRRRRRGETRPPVLTRLDRLVIRTLVVNGLFLGVMLWQLPRVAFRALAVRGDWMLDGAHGELANRVRAGFLDVADHFEKRWHVDDGRYGQSDDVPEGVEPVAEPAPTPETPEAADPYPDWPLDPEPDLAVQHMPAEAQASIATVGAYLAERFPDPRRRVKAMHDFVDLRLSYDHPAAEEKISRPPQDADSVFARKTAVCEGYARLMVALGKAAGVDIAYITGYARDGAYQANDQLATDDAVRASLGGYLHAWNAAKLDGKWTLIDATWDDPDDDGAPIRSDYLFTPPVLFAAQHLPDLPPWQLLAAPITAGEFVRRPLLVPAAGKLGVSLVEPTRSQVTTHGTVELVIDNPRRALVTADFTAPGLSGQHDCGEPTSDAHATLHCELPAGSYEVRLFGAASKTARHLAYLGSVSVNRR